MKRVLVVGLDGFSPDLVDAWADELPHISSLKQRGIYGELESIIQPVTPAAWTAMISGHNPGYFGFTDFTYRPDRSYAHFELMHSRKIQVPTLFTLLPQAGARVMAIGVPISYPPVEIAGGVCVSCFMAPSLQNEITSPAAFKQELLAHTSSPYLLDVALSDLPQPLDYGELARRLLELDRQRFDTASHLMKTRDWNLLFLVCMGTDRVGHYFKRFQDQKHRRYDPDPRYQQVMREQYRYCDTRLGELLELIDADTSVLVVSDHGMQSLKGKVNLNDWLSAKGYLRVTEPVRGLTPLQRAPIDWSETRAWAHGYAGQIYLNVQGRDPQGCIPAGEVEATLQALESDLQGLVDPAGQPLRAEVTYQQDIYHGPLVANCPDLCVQFEQVSYTTSDLLGHDEFVTPVEMLGPDDAAHAPRGFFALAGPGIPALGRFSAAHILDIAPTLFDLLEVPRPADLEGRPLHTLNDVYSHEEKTALTSRLQALYLE